MVLQRRGVRNLLLGSLLVLGGCGPNRTLEQAIQCDQFKRLPDGTWSATQEVVLDYKSKNTHYQLTYTKGSKITVDTAKEAREDKEVPKVLEWLIGKTEPQEGSLVAALDKKCAAKQ